MNKHQLRATLSGAITLLLMSLTTLSTIYDEVASGENIIAAYALDEAYTLTLSSANAIDFAYSPFEDDFAVNNYNDDPIVFKYKRAQAAPGAFVKLSGAGDGGFIYNDYLESSVNFNGLDGIDKITINYSSSAGSLRLYYSFASNDFNQFVPVVSGQQIIFTDSYPSHIKIANESGAGSVHDVVINSVIIKYQSYSFYEQYEPEFTTILNNQPIQTLGAKETYTVTIPSSTSNVGDKNYLHLDYTSTQNIKGTITYKNNVTEEVASENFFLEKEVIAFNTFLDAFRNSAKANFEKTILSLSFQNVGSSSATFKLNSFGMNNRQYSRGDIFYIADDMIEVGVSLRLGGAVASVKNISTATGYNIQEYVTMDGEIKIKSSDDNPDDIRNVIIDHPNLVNSFDLGREVQQSYYIGVDETNGYTRHQYDGQDRDYNPVQAGDNHRNESQIVDFSITRDSEHKITAIWIKTKACDWAADNFSTDSYMENTYTVSNGLIHVNNRFVDFSNFANYPFDDTLAPSYISNAMATANGWGGRNTSFGFLGKQTVELPAFYVSHPLSYYSSYVENRLIFDNQQGWNSNTAEQVHVNTDELAIAWGTYNGEPIYKSAKTSGTYHYATRNHPEDWMGYFNEDFFGVGIYIPATSFHRDGNYRHVFTSGNYHQSHNASEKINRAYLDENYELQYARYGRPYFFSWEFYNLEIESYVVDNTNYMSSILGFYPHEYVVLDWSYAIGADYLDNLRTKFNNLKDNAVINNNFSVWSGAEI